MSCAAGPDIKEDGLVLALDGGNNKSHSSNRFISYGSGLITQGISFQVNGNGTFQRVAAGTVIGGYTVKATDVVYSYALGSNGCHYHGNSAPIPTGSYATFSFDYLVTGATTYPIIDYLANFENYGGGALSGAVATANSLQNVWQRRTFTSGPTASAGTQAMLLYPGACGGRLADSGTIYFRNPKVEWTNVDTGDGNFSSMPNVTTWYDMSGNGNNGTLTNTPYYIMGSNNINNYLQFDGVDDYVNVGTPSISVGKITVNAWVKINAGSITQHVVDSASNAWHLAILNSNRPYFWNGSVYHQASPILTVGQWYMLTGVQGTTLDIYINGVLGQSIVTNVNVTTNNVNLGRYQSGGRQLNGNIAQVSIYNRALTAAEVRQNYNAVRARYEKGGIDNPFSSPTEARILGYTSGDYYFKSGSMSSPQLLEFQRDYYENRGWVCVFRSPYRSTATTNRIGLNIPMGGLLVQRDALDLRAAVYWSTPITYNTVGGAGNNTADSGYSPRRVILGGSGGHGIFATNQNQCSWGTATGAIGAGWDGSTCGSFPNDLVWGTGRSDTATYENRSGIWSHWITWN